MLRSSSRASGTDPARTGPALDEELPRRLTMSLIAECTITEPGSASSAQERANGLLETRVLRLDWQRISSIQNLDAFTCVRELYLQHNRIQVIEELDTLQNLQILSLGSNRIRCVENIRHLEKLQVLDLSNNLITKIDSQEELPHALVILNLAENPCCQDAGYRESVINSLSDLMILDGKPVDRPSQGADLEPRRGDKEDACQALEDGEEGGIEAVVQLYIGSGCSGESTENTTSVQQTEQTVKTSESPISSDGRCAEEPESEEGIDSGHDERLQAIISLQQARARVMEESTASFEQHKNHLLSTTRKLVEHKRAAAHGRSDALEADIRKTLEDARLELQIRRSRVSAENRQFATDMRQKVDRVFAERRRESEAIGRNLPNIVAAEGSAGIP